MLIQTIGQTVQQYIPSREQVVEKFSISLPQIVHNTSKVALPAIALFALANIPGVDGGPLAYGICVAWCTALASPVLLPACIIGCIAAGTAPTP